MCFTKHLKSKFQHLRYKITYKLAAKDFIKIFPTCIFKNFLQHFPNRFYPSVKIILLNLYVIKTILIYYRFPCRPI